MNKKILLSTAITAVMSSQSYAVPFQVLDARTMGMGGTGVASAPLSAVVPYNPALMATTRSDDHFSLNLRGGVYMGDSDDVIDATDDFEPDVKADELNALIGDDACSNCIVKDMDNLVTSGADIAANITTINNSIATLNDSGALAGAKAAAANDLNTAQAALSNNSTTFDQASDGLGLKAGTGGELQTRVFDITNFLENDVSNSRLKFGGGLGFQIAVPSKTFSFALSLDTSISGSGTITVSQDDTSLLEDYTLALGGMVDLVAGTQSSTGAADNVVDFATNVTTLAADVQDNATIDDAANAAAVLAAINGDDGTAGGAGSLEEQINSVTGYDYQRTNGDFLVQDGAIPVDQQEPDMKSTIHLYGAAVSDIGIAIAREFEIKGKKISFGITPKIQKINVFEFIAEVDGQDPATGQDIDFDNVEFEDYHKEYSAFNIDLGAAHRFGFSERWQTGVVVKNLLGKSYASTYGRKVDIAPMVRTGISYENIDWWLKPKFAADLDITENKPTAFEDPTRFLALGAELDLFRTLQLRAGYRTNLSASDQNTVSVGIGFSPLAIHMDVAAYANPSDVKKEAGVAFELGVEF